jgi:hypothetical protein
VLFSALCFSLWVDELDQRPHALTTIGFFQGWNFGGPSRVSRLELGLQLAKDASFDASLIQTISQVDIPSRTFSFCLLKKRS